MKIDSLPVIGEPSIPEEEEEVEEKEEEKKPEFEKKELNWEEDMMLFSKYLDRKVGHQTFDWLTSFFSSVRRTISVSKVSRSILS